MASPENLNDILRRKYWIFDLDGTLTVAIHDFAAIRRALGIPSTADILGHLEALPEHEALPLQQKLRDIEYELAGRTEPSEGALLLVQRLYRLGARLGILTRNTRDNAARTLERIGLAPFIPVSHILGREEAVAKPDPDGILKLAALWGAAPQELVMVGDYRFDLETGRAAGAATVHVDTSGAFRWPDLTDLAVANLAELARELC